MSIKYDFGGYATKNDLLCGDGRIIRRDAFKSCDGRTVPLVYQHDHSNIHAILGHADLENRADGVYANCKLNDSPEGVKAKCAIQNGDVDSLSIYANKLVQKGSDVVHGVIREVSLVLAGANPGATIDVLSFAHGDYDDYEDGEAILYTGEFIESLQHADSDNDEEEKKENKVAKNEDVTIGDIIDTMNEDQKNVMYYLIGEAEKAANDDEEGDDMSHSIFDNDNNEEVLSHAEIEAAFTDAKRIGSLKESFLEHGIESIDVLFPEAKTVTPTPELINTVPSTWVTEVWNATRKTPFARIKSTAADVTADEARAKGYIKGKKKIEEQLSLLKRTTTPQTVYKLQKLDRDDIIDITDLDVVGWMKAEMRMKLDEELSRAILVGDGRSAVAEDKIKEDNIRPIYQDDDMYTIHYNVPGITEASDMNERSDALIEAAIRARKEYRGSGNPVFYATTDIINDMLLAKDKVGRRLYANMNELASALRVSNIVEVPVLEGVTRETTDNKTKALLGLIVNLVDYTIGADKGGAVNLFDDFDIDYNKYTYLIETRCSGALTKPYSAIALEMDFTTSVG